MPRTTFSLPILLFLVVAMTTAGCDRGASLPDAADNNEAGPLSDAVKATPKEQIRSDWNPPIQFQKALENGRLANKGFDSANRFLKGWLGNIDTQSGLLPQYLHDLPGISSDDDPETFKNIWTPMNNASDLYPFLALAAFITDQDLYNGVIKNILKQERELTMTPSGLPANYLLVEQKKTEQTEHEKIFNASEYVKDGLTPLMEYTNDQDWLNRSKELMEAINKAANVGTVHGILPSADSEINGEMMQSLYRLYYITGEAAYLENAQRFGDAYFKIILPGNNGYPCHSWDFGNNRPYDTHLQLRDHGNEVVLGLAMVYALLFNENKDVANEYRPAFEKMLDLIAENGRDKRGFFYNSIDTKTGQVIDSGLSDNWGYILCAYYIHYLCHQDEKYLEPVRTLLANLDQVKDYKWEIGVDGLADSLESAVYLVNRLPSAGVTDWIDYHYSKMFARQSEKGIVEGTYLDGNFTRTVLLIALMKTAGVRFAPWDSKIIFGSYQENDVLYVAVQANTKAVGRLRFDNQRWSEWLHLPMNLPRVNEWPVWWAAQPKATYQVEVTNEQGEKIDSSTRTGAELIAGIPMGLSPGQMKYISISELLSEQLPETP